MLHTARSNRSRDFCSFTHHSAIPMPACTRWTQSSILSPFATTPECSFAIGDRQSKMKWWNCGWSKICNGMYGIDAWRRVIHHRGVSDDCNRAHPLWWRVPSGSIFSLLMYIIMVAIWWSVLIKVTATATSPYCFTLWKTISIANRWSYIEASHGGSHHPSPSGCHCPRDIVLLILLPYTIHFQISVN